MQYVCKSLCPHLYVLMLQSMEAGTSGANGPYAAVSARGSGVGNATPQHPDTEARCAKGTVRPLRTAQMDCVPRVRPFSPAGHYHHHHHHHSHYCPIIIIIIHSM